MFDVKKLILLHAQLKSLNYTCAEIIECQRVKTWLLISVVPKMQFFYVTTWTTFSARFLTSSLFFALSSLILLERVQKLPNVGNFLKDRTTNQWQLCKLGTQIIFKYICHYGPEFIHQCHCDSTFWKLIFWQHLTFYWYCPDFQAKMSLKS